MSKLIVMTGDPVDGFKFYGPFDEAADAYTFGDTCRHAAWFVVELETPEEV
jgi:hypothetical protein